MAAVRLARFNTRRKYIVTFAGAYHGWWDGVQPAVGSEREIPDCIVMNEMAPATLSAIRMRAAEIAGVLVNPIQSFHPNSPPPSDAVLLSSDVRATRTEEPYGIWLKQLAETCRQAGVPLIFDEVFSGFRLAPGGAQERFGVSADMVVYGKTVAGGMPIGVVCGPHSLMRRFDQEHPMRLAYVVGTFSAHPLTMGAMNGFLEWVMSPEAAVLYQQADERCARWMEETNARLSAQQLPVRIARFTTVFTLLFTHQGRYNWLLQYYLRAEGVNLSWVGTGRCMTSLDYQQEDYDALQEKIVAAASAMQAAGWWLTDDNESGYARTIQRKVKSDMLQSLFPISSSITAFISDVMRRKHDDHVASHSNRINQVLHLFSSSAFLICYVLIFFDLAMAMWIGLASLFVRQFGHAVIEPPCHDKEQLLLGFDTRSKTLIVAGYLLIPVMAYFTRGQGTEPWLPLIAQQVAEQWFVFTVLVIAGRICVLAARHGLRNALVWFIKLITDPITDISAYHRSVLPAR